MQAEPRFEVKKDMPVGEGQTGAARQGLRPVAQFSGSTQVTATCSHCLETAAGYFRFTETVPK